MTVHAFLFRAMMNTTASVTVLNNNTVVSKMWNTTMTPVEETCTFGPYYQKIVIMLFMISVILSVFENLSLWIAFWYNPSLRTSANAYVISLSVSDFFTAISLAVLEIYYVWEYPFWVFGEMGSMLQNSFWCLSLVTPFTHITVITIDRYRAVSSKTLHRRSWRKDLTIIAAMWTYSIGMVSLMAYHFTPAPALEYTWNVLPKWYYPFIGVHIFLPLILCSVFYYLIYREVRNSRKDLKHFHVTDKEFKFARTIGIIILLLYLVWLPVIGMEVVYAVLAYTCTISKVGVISVLLTCTSGVINPLIFLSKNKKYRHTIFKVIFCWSSSYNDILYKSTTTTTASYRVNSRFQRESVSSCDKDKANSNVNLVINS